MTVSELASGDQSRPTQFLRETTFGGGRTVGIEEQQNA